MKRMLEVSFLLGAVLVVAVFTKGNVRDFLIVGVTLSWLIANVCVLLKPKMMAFVEDFKIKLYSKILMESKNDILVYPATEENNREEVNNEQDIPEEQENTVGFDLNNDFLVRNVNFRVTDKLKKYYPKVTWSWDTHLSEIGGNVKNARIKTFNTGDYNFADVTFLPSGEINLKMQKIVELTENVENKKQNIAEDEVKEWYETCAFNVISETINEIYSQGYKSLEIADNGTIYIKEQNKDVECNKIENMLDKSLWNEFAKCLKKDDIKARVLNDRLALSWGGSI